MALANEDTEILRLDESDLDELLAQDPELAINFYRTLARDLAGRLTNTTRELSFLKGHMHIHHV